MRPACSTYARRDVNGFHIACATCAAADTSNAKVILKGDAESNSTTNEVRASLRKISATSYLQVSCTVEQVRSREHDLAKKQCTQDNRW